MKTPYSVVGRLGRILAIGAFAVTLAPVVPVAAQSVDALDLPAALMYPSDVESAGFEDYGLVMGWYGTPEDMILSVEALGVDPEEARSDIESSGMGSLYSLSLHPITEPKDGELYGFAIESSIVQFESEKLASESLEVITTAVAGEDYDVLDDMPAFGDESLAIHSSPAAGVNSPQPEDNIDIGIRVGSVVASVKMRGLGEGIESDPERAEVLGETLEAKLLALVSGDQVGNAEAPNLSQIMPDYFNDVLCVCRIQYMIYGGEAVDLAYRADELDARTMLAEEYGVQSQFYTLIKPATRDQEQNDLSLRVRVTRFDHSRDAATYVENANQWMQDFPEQMRPFSNVETAIEYGEVDGYRRAVALSYETEGDRTGAPLEGTALFVQSGPYVFEVSLDGDEAPEIDVLIDVINQLEGCMDDDCTTAVNVPQSVIDYFISQSDAAN